jgi:hypothetical protein
MTFPATGSVLVATLLCVAPCGGQTNPRPPLASHVSPADVATGEVARVERVRPARYHVGTTDPMSYSIASDRQRLSAGQRWENFHAEFGIQQRSASTFKSTLEAAKYRLDSATFVVSDFVETMEERFEFEYELRNLNPAPHRAAIRPIYDNPISDMLDNARFRSDIDLDVGAGRAFVGVRLVLPFGD